MCLRNKGEIYFSDENARESDPVLRVFMTTTAAWMP